MQKLRGKMPCWVVRGALVPISGAGPGVNVALVARSADKLAGGSGAGLTTLGIRHSS